MTTKWPTVPLGTLFKTSSGATPLKSRKDFYQDGNIPWLLSGEVSQGSIDNARNFITEKALTETAAKLFPVNSVLVAMYGATAGQVGLLGFESATNQAVCAIYPSPDYLPRFVYYALLSMKKVLVSQAVGNAQPNVSQAKIKDLPFPVVSLDEQKHIVAKLDEASMQLEFLDQVNVKSKVSEGLFIQRFIDARINEMLTEVEQSPLGDVALLVRGPFGGSLKKSMFVAAGYPIYEQQHPISGDLSSFRYFIDVEKFESMKRFAVSAGDVLMSCSGTFGKVVEVTQQAPLGVINQALLKITPSPDINSSYLKTLMTSDYFQEHVRVGVLGSAMQNVASVAELKAIPIPVPDLDTQKEFVSEAEALQMQSRRMGDIRGERSRQIIKLREVILSAAFAGEL